MIQLQVLIRRVYICWGDRILAFQALRDAEEEKRMKKIMAGYIGLQSRNYSDFPRDGFRTWLWNQYIRVWIRMSSVVDIFLSSVLSLSRTGDVPHGQDPYHQIYITSPLYNFVGVACLSVSTTGTKYKAYCAHVYLRYTWIIAFTLLHAWDTSNQTH